MVWELSTNLVGNQPENERKYTENMQVLVCIWAVLVTVSYKKNKYLLKSVDGLLGRTKR